MVKLFYALEQKATILNKLFVPTENKLDNSLA